MEAKFRKQFPNRKLLDIVSSTRIWKMQHNAAVIIQRAWRSYFARKHAVIDRVKSTQTVSSGVAAHPGFGQKLGQFFRMGGDKRRRSSLRDGIPYNLKLGGSATPKDGKLNPKNFYLHSSFSRLFLEMAELL